MKQNVCLWFLALSALVTSFASAQQKDVVDYNALPILQCVLPSGVDPALGALICNKLRPKILDELMVADDFLDAVLVGFEDEVPAELINQLGVAQITVNFEQIDGPGNTLATSAPTDFRFFPEQEPQLIFVKNGVINIDIDDIQAVIENDRFVDVIIHSSLHALGFPSVFQFTGLIEDSGLVNYVGNDGAGFAISEYQVESGDSTFDFVPLEQATSGGHLCPFQSAFVRPDIVGREVLTPMLDTFCARAFMSRTLRGMYADLGYLVPGINAPGMIDIDGDGIDDDPLFVSPTTTNIVLLADLNGDGQVNLLDVEPFVSVINSGEFVCEADVNLDGRVDLTDVSPFIQFLTGI